MKRAITNFSDVEQALKPYIPLVKKLTGKDTVLDRIVPLMDFLGHPEDKIKAIHIAGTSGKTSTAHYISSLLTEAGLKVGLTISPHIDKVSERAQINNKPLSERLFCSLLSEFLDLLDQSKIKPSYFELLCAFSIWVFNKLQVDYAVIETGLGGLYDATNVVSRSDKICVLTDIGFDHMSILGNTIPEITRQKVGIVHEGNQVIMYPQSKDIMTVVNSWVKDHSAELHIFNKTIDKERINKLESYINLPNYQKRNWLLAYYTYCLIAKRDSLNNLNDQELSKSQSIVIPARMDISKANNHTLVMDGAHNYQKMSTFIASYRAMFKDIKPAILLAFKSDKAYLSVLPLITDFASEIIVTTFKISQDTKIESCSPEDIIEELTKLGFKNLKLEPDYMKAYNLLINSKTKHIVITGSFYLIANIRKNLRS